MHAIVRWPLGRKGTFPALAVLFLLLIGSSSCGSDAPAARPVAPPETPEETARIPMGILYDGTRNPEELRPRLRALRKAGGNYFALYVRPDNVGEVGEFAALAAEIGLRFDVYDQKRLVPNYEALPALIERDDRNTAFHFPATDFAGYSAQLLSDQPHVVGLEPVPALFNAIRGLRIVESRIDLPSILRATNVGGTAIGGDLLAVVDKNGNYAIYLPGPGVLDIELPDNTQDRRVTVVGYLGTQKTEILRAPYDLRVRLTSEEERGGWMLITGR